MAFTRSTVDNGTILILWKEGIAEANRGPTIAKRKEVHMSELSSQMCDRSRYGVWQVDR